MALAIRVIETGAAFLRHPLPACALFKQTEITKAAFSTFSHFGLPSVKSSSQSSTALVSRVNTSRTASEPAIQSRFFSTQKDGSECELVLYHIDRRRCDRKWLDTTKISFSKQTAKKANDVVASYFGISEEWDKKLLKSIFLNDIQFNWFEFTRIDNPQISLGISITGDRSVVFNENPEEFYSPIERPIKLSVMVTNIFGISKYELTYEKIRKERSKDFSIVALFNSNSFKSVTACSTNLGFIRTLEKFDVMPTKKVLI